MELKKIFASALLLLVAGISFYLALMWGLNHFQLHNRRALLWAAPYLQRKGGHEKLLFDDFERNRPYDVLVIGSSHAYRGYDPRIFKQSGLRMFTMGTSAQHPLASKLLAENYFDLSEKPLVIYELYDMTFMLEGVECSTRLIQNLPDDDVAWQMTTSRADLRNINAFINREMVSGIPSEYDMKGYVRNGFAMRPDSATEAPAEIDKEFVMRKEMLIAFDETLSMFETMGLRCVLVSHPQPKADGYATFHNEFLVALNLVLQKHNTPYFDFSLDHRFHDLHHFYDGHHLNQAGVDLFNPMIIAKLMEHGYLPAQ